ncbi:heparan-alpha-glucosaminide N-acetyltransferase domain-containing protein [Kocuria sp.]|uniref:heparan-alpha-glucosaminide N-acetyltransferase domain-containing protein n=1 Tax=Kocuria sp. TaxID=1871328 RepID=UPI0026DF55DE|nr:heparan-alpha-glucosaminide N-acetyltransferase domain-containing protein [Kocuria sp.]MDO5617969.1 heparan-alpha-glucosaminide N-acetyltransferase domain-containing protein [Kocuria sp.]
MIHQPQQNSLAAHLRRNALRLEPPRREPGIDLARGLAILGMFAAHLMLVPELVWATPETWLGVVEGRSSIVFATLAGVSLGLLGQRNNARQSIAIRAVIIWTLGLGLLGFGVPVYIVLPAYGLLLLAGAVMVTWSTRVLLVVAAVVVTAAPFVVALVNRNGPPVPDTPGDALFNALGWNYPFVLWVAFIAVGLVVGRMLTGGTRRLLVMIAGGVAAAVVGYGMVGPVGNAVVDTYGDYLPPGTRLWALSVLQSYPHSSGVGEAVGSGGFAVALIGVCVLVGRTWMRWPLWPVRVLGSMPLTAYVAHLVVWGVWMMSNPEVGWVIDPLDGFRALDPFWPMTLGVAAGCIAWALLVGRGPMETLLHSAENMVSPKNLPKI